MKNFCGVSFKTWEVKVLGLEVLLVDKGLYKKKRESKVLQDKNEDIEEIFDIKGLRKKLNIDKDRRLS